MDLAERYLERTNMLLRLLDPEDLGHLVDFEARQEIQRCLRLTDPEPCNASSTKSPS